MPSYRTRAPLLPRVSALAFAAALAACQPVDAPVETGVAAPADPMASTHPAAGMAPTFVQAACADCHGVEPDMISPIPGVPAFSDIANRDGVTRESLIVFLRDAHNYPEQMDFDLDDDNIAQIADYMMKLQSGDYRRSPS